MACAWPAAEFELRPVPRHFIMLTVHKSMCTRACRVHITNATLPNEPMLGMELKVRVI